LFALIHLHPLRRQKQNSLGRNIFLAMLQQTGLRIPFETSSLFKELGTIRVSSRRQSFCIEMRPFGFFVLSQRVKKKLTKIHYFFPHT